MLDGKPNAKERCTNDDDIAITQAEMNRNGQSRGGQRKEINSMRKKKQERKRHKENLCMMETIQKEMNQKNERIHEVSDQQK